MCATLWVETTYKVAQHARIDSTSDLRNSTFTKLRVTRSVKNRPR